MILVFPCPGKIPPTHEGQTTVSTNKTDFSVSSWKLSAPYSHSEAMYMHAILKMGIFPIWWIQQDLSMIDTYTGKYSTL